MQNTALALPDSTPQQLPEISTKNDKKVTPQAPQDVAAARSPVPTIRDRSAKQPTFGPVEQPPLKIVSRSAGTRASNAARAALVVANVTPTGYRVGLFMANKARYATLSDIRRNVSPGEIFCYWPQAKIAAKLGCSESTVSRGVRSLREAGVLTVRQRVRPCEASYVWVVSDQSPDQSSDQSNARPYDVSGASSGDGSGDWSHTEPRTEPQKNHVGSSRAREPRQTCPDCGRSWPAEYGTDCYLCQKATRDTPSRRPRGGRPTLGDRARPTAVDDLPPDGYRGSRVRNCPACHVPERGYEDRCQSCDWTREGGDTERPARPDAPPMTAEQRTDCEDRLRAEGWKQKEDGLWQRRR